MNEWYPTECAPVLAPAEIVSGRFLTRGQADVHLASGTVINNGWGATGATFVSGPGVTAPPERLQLRWFSYAEDAFYEGDFAIDGGRLERLFEAGYQRPLRGDRGAFDRIVVGLAPGGGVALWLKGEQITREIAFYQAAAVAGDWGRFSGDAMRGRGEYVQAQLGEALEPEQIGPARVAANTGAGRWSGAFRSAWSWAPKLISRGRVRQLMIRYFNGEVLEDSGDGIPRMHPLPEQIDLYWANPDGLNYGASIRFDFDEVFQAFGLLVPVGAIRLTLEADTLSTSVAVFVQSDTESYRFRKAAVRVFRM